MVETIELTIRFNRLTKQVAVSGPLLSQESKECCLEAIAGAMVAVVGHRPGSSVIVPATATLATHARK